MPVNQPAEKFLDAEEEKKEIAQAGHDNENSLSVESETHDIVEDSDFEVKEVGGSEVNHDIHRAIADLTKDFTLTFAQIKSTCDL